MKFCKLFISLTAIAFLAVMVTPEARAQQANIGFNCVGGAPGDTVCMDVTIGAIDSVYSGEMTLAWNQLALEFLEITNKHPFFNTPFTFNPDPVNGRMKMLWLASNFDPGVSFTSGEILYSICFIARGAPSDYGVRVVETNADPFEFVRNPGVVVPVNPGHPPGPQGCAITVTPPSTISGFFSGCLDNSGGPNTGIISVSVFGGVPPYNLSWTGPASGSGIVAAIGGTFATTAIPQGNYQFTITDNSGASRTYPVALPFASSGVPLGFGNTNSRAPSCEGRRDGLIEIRPQGGTPPYLVEWSTGIINSNRIDGLSVGTYTVTVTDANGCQLINNYPLTVAPIQANLIQNQAPLCPGLANAGGTLLVGGFGGNPFGGGQYSFQWFDEDTISITQPNIRGTSSPAPARTVQPGHYLLVIEDANACRDTFAYDMIPQKQLNVVATVTPPTCAGDSDARMRINFDMVRGTPSTSYNMTLILPGGNNNAFGQGGFVDFSNLDPGCYGYSVRDEDGCIWTNDDLADCPILIQETLPLTVRDSLVNGESCTTGNDGSIALFMQGGTQPYTYAWNGRPDRDSTIRNLASGTYAVTVTDRNGCTSSFAFDINRTRVPVEIDTLRTITCQGGADGGLQAVVPAGVTVTYAWNNNRTTAANTNLAAGTYTITVQDAQGCQGIATVDLLDPGPIRYTFNITHPQCYGLTNGVVGVTPAGGTAPYTYQWSVAGAGNFSTLPAIGAGTYTVTITDANNCPSTVADTSLVDPAAIALSFDQVQPALCFNPVTPAQRGRARVTASAGVGTYNYQWDDGVTNNLNTLLSGGWHRVSVVDANNCTNTDSIFIDSPLPIRLDSVNTRVINTTCFGRLDGSITASALGGVPGYTYRWFAQGVNAALLGGYGAGTYEVQVTDANGCTDTLAATISQPDSMYVLLDSANTVMETCANDNNGQMAIQVVGGNAGPRTYVWTNNLSDTTFATGLDTGTYVIRVTDVRGCQSSITHFLDGPDPLRLTFDPINPIACYGEKTEIRFASITGGNTPTDYIYQVNNNPGQSSNIPFQTGAGTFLFRITDKRNCFIDTTVTLTEPPEILVDFGEPATLDLGDSINVFPIVTGLYPINDYAWTPADQVTCLDAACQNVLLQPTGTTTFSLMVTDSTGCIQTADYTVSVVKRRNVYIPNAFSPNGDGRNDLFQVFTGTGVVNIKNFIIFDRYGNLMFAKNNLAPSFGGTEGWDGRVFNQDLLPGVYVYMIDVEFIDGLTLTYRGDVTLFR